VLEVEIAQVLELDIHEQRVLETAEHALSDEADAHPLELE